MTFLDAAAQTAVAARRHRLGAFLIDSVILVVAGAAVRTALNSPVGDTSAESAGVAYGPDAEYDSILQTFWSNPYAGNPYWYLDLTLIVLWVLYFWLSHALWGQTVGKRLCRLKVVAADGGRLTAGRAGVRALIYAGATAVPYVGVMVGLVDALWIFAPRKRCLHDVLAGSIVIDISAGSRGRGPGIALFVGLGLIVLLAGAFLFLAWSR
ncbi:hypothetical protein Sme01_23700 [Sphaerisporangium melleum]|uniref:RDD domain-containing protein n=1 Tax=Sphaerisporangium melleum TaxID=321316 RepID=A0A917QS91_9ACTN|nr:RDD family protein [Sphaerisporangium melleum]GGK65951.1 hypothetical protein GCM10007964_06240 [Sphaerisporangium melleum]GII69894.1 hypothetical protein Sme01_23700 [Sphaerisporangium melleum]